MCILTWVLKNDPSLKTIEHKNVRCAPKIKIETKPLPAAFEGALERFFTRVNELVTFQFARLHKRLAALGAHVDTWTVGVQVLPHGRVVPEHFVATFVRTR